MFKTHQWNKEEKKVNAPLVIGKNGKIVANAKPNKAAKKAKAGVKVGIKVAKKKKSKGMGDYDGEDFEGAEEFEGVEEFEGEMDGAFDFLADINNKYLKAPIQKAIDTNKAKIIEKATSAGINAVGKALDKVGGTDPKKLAAVQAFAAAATQGAVEGAKASVMEKVKPYIPWAIGGVAVLSIAFVVMKKRKTA
jgi:hypothetical protein